MEIKKIKLSPKKGGNGFLSSYSVSIGIKEAEACDLACAGTEKTIIKIVDTQNRQIVIKEKQYTLTKEIIDTIINYARRVRALNKLVWENAPSAQRHGKGYVINMAAYIDVKLKRNSPYIDECDELKREFHDYLLSLPMETLSDVMTLMYMGREKQVKYELPPKERFIEYWVYLDSIGAFGQGQKAIASQIMEKSPLAEYLREGQNVMYSEGPFTEEPVSEEVSMQDLYEEWL